MAKKELINADDAHLFWVEGNGALRNLKDLAESLRNMSDDTFTHHVNAEKNDFANWVTEILQDSRLASELKRAKSRITSLKKVEARLKTHYNV